MNCETAVLELGFAQVDRVLEPEEAERLAASLDETRLRRSRAGIRHLLSFDAVSAIAHDARLVGLAYEILGDGAFPFRATLLDKSPTTDWLIPWHQDTALPLKDRHETPGWGPWSVKAGVVYAHAPASALNQVLALRLHLDDSTILNGPLRVLPGTHKLGLLSDDEVYELAQRIPPVDCPVPCGGVLLMRPLLVHSSSKLSNKMPRRVLHIEYSSSRVIAAGIELADA